MKKRSLFTYILLIVLAFSMVFSLAACKGDDKDAESKAVYAKLKQAEELCGILKYQNKIISSSGQLDIPTEYEGVTISYKSLNEDIISSTGYVTQPTTQWIHSRDQQGEIVFDGLNDVHPVGIWVTFTYKGETRTAKLIIRVRPIEGAELPPYLGFDVTFVVNGGSNVVTVDGINKKRVAEGQKVAKPEDPTKAGYTFGGWYTNEACTIPYDFNTPVSSNFKLYAKWI